MQRLFVCALLSLAVAGAVPLAGCSDSQVAATNAALDKYDHALDNWNAIYARVSASTAKTSATVKPYCDSALAVGGNVAKIVKGSDAALTALDALAAGLNDFCLAPPQDAAAAVVFLAQAIADGQAVVKKGG